MVTNQGQSLLCRQLVDRLEIPDPAKRHTGLQISIVGGIALAGVLTLVVEGSVNAQQPGLPPAPSHPPILVHPETVIFFEKHMPS